LKDTQATIKEIKQFGLTLTIALTVIRIIIMLKHGYVNQWLLYIAIGLFSISLILPKTLKPIYKVWMKVTTTISKVISFVILGLFFYLIITPIGLFMKIIRRDPLQRRFDRNTDSYWINRDAKLNDPKRIERQF